MRGRRSARDAGPHDRDGERVGLDDPQHGPVGARRVGLDPDGARPDTERGLDARYGAIACAAVWPRRSARRPDQPHRSTTADSQPRAGQADRLGEGRPGLDRAGHPHAGAASSVRPPRQPASRGAEQQHHGQGCRLLAPIGSRRTAKHRPGRRPNAAYNRSARRSWTDHRPSQPAMRTGSRVGGITRSGGQRCGQDRAADRPSPGGPSVSTRRPSAGSGLR